MQKIFKILLASSLLFIVTGECSSQIVYQNDSVGSVSGLPNNVPLYIADSILKRISNSTFAPQDMSVNELVSEIPLVLHEIAPLKDGSLEPPGNLILDSIRPLVEKIQNLKKIQWYKRNKKEVVELLKQITSLSLSKEKIWLLVQCSSLNFKLMTNSSEIEDVCRSADSLADEISDPFNKCIAHKYIGDFASENYLETRALTYYYKAHEFAIYSNKSDSLKNLIQAEILIAIGRVFKGVQLKESLEKAANYYLAAAGYYKAAKNENGAKIAFSMYLSETLKASSFA